MKVALVYDRVNKIGGAERVLLALHEIYPDAPLYTAVYNPKGAPWAKVFPKVIPSFLEKFPFAKSHHEIYPWLMPLAFESFNFDEYDLVISVTSEAAKGIITKPKTYHLCYCLTPTRYLWQSYWEYFKNPFWRVITKPLVVRLRLWDQIASSRPDTYIAISQNVAQRIKKYYRREAEVIYPPVDLKKFAPKLYTLHPNPYSQKSSAYFLVVSRLVPYKRIDIAIKAFNKLGLPLKIVGSGVEERKLKRIARSNIEFLGQNLTDDELLQYYQNCRAIIFPGEEDFGLVPIEAQACGKPIIAFEGGGVLESVIEGVTGEFFSPQTPEALARVVKQFKDERYKPEECRKNAEKFSKENFKKKFKEYILRCQAIQHRGLTKRV
ncbi:glycosyltransferase [Candidatus Gottesmanbacteria bacterium]|nr:glycosyltransferase [Candidatus Gottesmanbacteria bacterium]